MPKLETIKTTCPRDCYDSCGVVVLKRDGVITNVRGDRDSPVNRGALCGKCTLAYNGIYRDPHARLGRPLKRVGPKGAGRFAPISWDQALETIASELRRIVAASGPHTIAYAHYTGTISKIAYAFPVRFFNRLGATEIEPDTICNMAGHVALQYTLGSSLIGFDPRTAKEARSIVVWGANPAASAPHAFKHWFREARGAKIVVDPVRHETARSADLHLQLAPGSDAALAFAFLHVLRREGKIDRSFIDSHVLGWDEIDPALDRCTPSWAEGVTDVPAPAIEEAARLYGAGPALLWLGQGMQRYARGGNAFRACAMLPAATGNFGKPGAGIYYLNLDGRVRGLDDDYLVAAHLRQGARRSFSHMELAHRLEDRDQIQALLCWNINPAASNPEQARLRSAMTREDLFTVVCDQFETDTTDFADIVLPAASFLEFDDLVASYFNLTIGPQSKAQEPIGEALPNQEIFRRLARAMEYEDPELYEGDEAILNRLLRGTTCVRGFEELKRKGTVFITENAVLQFADLAFPTPSGRIEIASARAEADGHPRLPLPLAEARPQRGRLRLLSPASPWLMNFSFANEARIDKRLGPADVALNPADAAAHGVPDGSLVRIWNETGEIVMSARLSDEIRPGVALSHKGRWPRREPGRANVNVLNPGTKTDMGESTCVHGIEVSIAPVRRG